MKTVEDIEDSKIDDFYKLIGSNVKKIRNKRGISQLQLSQALGHKSVGLVSQSELYLKKQSHYLKRKVMERKKHTLVDNADEKRYEFDLGDDIAIIEYIKTQGFIILTHTEVPEKYEGQGIGAELVHDVLEDLRAKKLQMIPQCPFIAQYIRRHPEWVDVVLKEIPAK